MKLKQIAEQINALSDNYNIGRLQYYAIKLLSGNI